MGLFVRDCNGLSKQPTIAERLISFSSTTVNASLLCLLLAVLLVLSVKQASALEPAQSGKDIKNGRSTVTKPTPKPEDVLIVQLRSGADRDEFDSLLKEINGEVINTLSMGPKVEFLIVATEPGTATETVKKLSASKEVSMVQRNSMYRPQQAASVPDDVLYSSQWDLSFMNYAQARALHAGSATPLLWYVCDTGLQPVGYELGQVAQQYDFSNATNPTGNKEKLHDVYFHGTAVSTVACSSNNVLGFAGVSNFELNRTQEVMCRITDSSGSASLVSILSALQFCWSQMYYRHMPVGPVNLSFGSSASDSLNSNAMIQQVAYGLRQVGSVLVLASGNDGGYDGSAELYARRVGAIGQNGELASFSDTGPFITAAPGVNIACYIPYSYLLPDYLSGTSGAAPRWCAAILDVMGALPPAYRSASYADQIVVKTGTVTSQGQIVPNIEAAVKYASSL